jgi:hypothetical protein
MDILQYESKIWATADLLRGSGIKESELPSYMMPFFALAMIESRLLRMFDDLKAEIGEEAFSKIHKDKLSALIKDKRQSYNNIFIFETCQSLTDICKNDKSFDIDFDAYLKGFDNEAKDLLGVNAGEGEKNLDIKGVIAKLKAKKILLSYTKLWADIDLKPFENSEITTLEEHIKRKMRELPNKDIVKAFAHEWSLCASAKSVLHIKASSFNLFPNLHDLATQEVNAVQDIPRNIRYDLILGDFPIGLNLVEWNDGAKTIKAQRDWLEILKSLYSLEANGTALFLLGPLGFSTSKGVVFEKELNERGFFVNAYINLPERILQPEALITPVFVALSKNPKNQLFVAELLDDAQAREVARAFFSNMNEDDFARGKYIDAGDFFGFHRIKIRGQIERLETQYKTYEEYSLGDLAVGINYVRSGEQLQERDNAIYIPKIGNSQVICRLEDAKLKHHNYFQVVLRELAINEYVTSFFRSALGRLVLDSSTSSTSMPRLTMKNIEQALVALPDLDEQKTIVQTQKKLHNLRSAIDEFDAELALNPTSSSSILVQLDMMIETIGELTDADRVRGIVREGETKYVEFKETLSLDVKKQRKGKYIEDSALKTVVGFLNTSGGKLLIGVSDDGQITGLDAEIKIFYKKLDKFLLHWANLLTTRIGKEYITLIEHRIINVDTTDVLFVECKSAQKPCFLDGNEFYVRINPATHKLEGPELLAYVNGHFK